MKKAAQPKSEREPSQSMGRFTVWGLPVLQWSHGGTPALPSFKIPGYQRFDIATKGMASAGLWSVLKKIAINTVNSAAGTGAVLGVHSAMTPEAPPPMTGSYQPSVKEETGIVNVDFGGASSMMVISIAALLIGLFFACCCNSKICSPNHCRKKRSEQRLSNEVSELTRQLEESRKEMETRLVAKMEEGVGEGERAWRSTIPRPKSPSDPTLGAPR